MRLAEEEAYTEKHKEEKEEKKDKRERARKQPDIQMQAQKLTDTLLWTTESWSEKNFMLKNSIVYAGEHTLKVNGDVCPCNTHTPGKKIRNACLQ